MKISAIDQKIDHYANMIISHKDKADDLALGELNFYIALRRVLLGNGTTQDLGMMDAINDFLQEKGIVEKSAKFYD